jgi:hypothetical protein
MSSDDQLRPFHAKDEARGQEAADAVAAVLKHAAEREKAVKEKTKRKPPPRWLLPLGIQLSVIALYLLFLPPRWVVLDPIQGPDPATRVEDLRRAMWFQIQRVESYKLQHGELPERLSDAGSPVEGVEYLRQSGNSYQLVATVGEEALVYDSNQSAEAFVGGGLDELRGGS